MHPRRMAVAIAFALLLPACGGPGTVPSSDVARTALETALAAWRDGKSPVDLSRGEPPLQVIDSEWAAGRKLSGFEVLKAEPSGDDKRFLVKLSLDTPKAEAEARFVVVGVRPVVVAREADYLRMLNMADNPTPKRKAPPRSR